MIEGLRTVNDWLDEFLIELSMPLLLIGFTMATTDLLVHGQLATFGPFEGLWSVVQAIAIDGLFFAIWLRIFKTKWLRSDWYKLVALVVAGLIMALVAMAVNDILTYQQINNIADSVIAMKALHIDMAIFTHVRAGLVIFVAILIIPIRKKPEPVDSPMATTAIAKRPRQRAMVEVKELPKEPPKELPEKVDSHMDIAKELSKEEQCIAKWLASDQGHGVKKAIALELGIGYSTVKKYIDKREKAKV